MELTPELINAMVEEHEARKAMAASMGRFRIGMDSTEREELNNEVKAHKFEFDRIRLEVDRMVKHG